MTQRSENGVLSHWSTFYEGFSTSTQEFYQEVEEAVRQLDLPDVEISRILLKEGGLASASREYLRVRHKRIVFDICSAPYANGHFFSWWLARVPAKYGLLAVLAIILVLFQVISFVELIIINLFGDSCLGMGLVTALFIFGVPVALFFLGFLVEQGKLSDEDWLLSIPVVGLLYQAVFNPNTYFKADTASMFRGAVKSAVHEVIERVLGGKGMREAREPDTFLE